ncbi:hypothetical protein ACWHBW_17040 [Streptomyces albidoflavus]
MPPAFLTTPTPRRTLLRGLGAGAAGFTITDQRGREIRFDGPVERIATAIIPSPSMIAAVDGSHSRVVGVNESTLQANEEGVFGTLLGKEKRERTGRLDARGGRGRTQARRLPGPRRRPRLRPLPAHRRRRLDHRQQDPVHE